MRLSEVKVGMNVVVTRWNAKLINRVGAVMDKNLATGYLIVKLDTGERVKFHCTSVSPYTHPLSAKEMPLRGSESHSKPFSQVGQLMVATKPYSASGRARGDVYRITDIQGTTIFFEYVSGKIPRKGWAKGSDHVNCVKQCWRMQ